MTIAHSGKKSVVGYSRVEEHISKQAFYELEQHSQQPANCVENKLDVSCVLVNSVVF